KVTVFNDYFTLKFRWSIWTGIEWSVCTEIDGQFRLESGGQFDRFFQFDALLVGIKPSTSFSL
ncbi:MAG: hypothetical protein L6Q46_13460, partial [Flavobacterium sp.]|uniref:hypothetical protein n=1 Tax=Flavobacterium sp. TaxID=239 RepID=UPI0025BDF45E